MTAKTLHVDKHEVEHIIDGLVLLYEQRSTRLADLQARAYEQKRELRKCESYVVDFLIKDMKRISKMLTQLK